MPAIQRVEQIAGCGGSFIKSHGIAEVLAVDRELNRACGQRFGIGGAQVLNRGSEPDGLTVNRVAMQIELGCGCAVSQDGLLDGLSAVQNVRIGRAVNRGDGVLAGGQGCDLEATGP